MLGLWIAGRALWACVCGREQTEIASCAMALRDPGRGSSRYRSKPRRSKLARRILPKSQIIAMALTAGALLVMAIYEWLGLSSN